MKNEVWVPLAGAAAFYGTHYEVSSYRRVRRVVGGMGARAGYILKPVYRGPYPSVILHKNGVGKQFDIHILVWDGFHPGTRTKGLEVNHKDTKKQNGRLDNLELMTRRENVDHAVRNGCYKTILTRADVMFARKHYKPFDKKFGCTALAERFGVSEAGMHHALSGWSWKNLGTTEAGTT